MDLMAKISDKIKTHGMGNSGHLIKKKRKKVQSIASKVRGQKWFLMSSGERIRCDRSRRFFSAPPNDKTRQTQ